MTSRHAFLLPPFLTPSQRAALLVLALAAAACGGDDEGGDETSPGESIDDCNDLCALEPTATTSERSCVADAVAAVHPQVATTPACAGIDSPEDCLSCYQAAGVDDGTCSSVGDSCF